jgi:ketosteroid isomerase-like protein
VTSPPDAPYDHEQVERELLDILRRLEAAENSGDDAYWASVMAEDVVLIVPDFPMQEGKAAASAFIADLSRWQDEHLTRHITYTSVEIVVEGDLAFDRGTFAFTVSEKGSTIQDTVCGKYLWVYRRTGGTWLMWRAAVTRDEDIEHTDDGAKPD